MLDRRLLALAPGARRAIALDVTLQWVGLLATIALFYLIGLFLQAVLAGTATAEGAAWLAGAAAAAIIVRWAAQAQATACGVRAATAAKQAVRQQVYDKLVRRGPAYREDVSTAEAVQVCVEGCEQLESYFAQYVPQLAYALIAPLTLFAFLAPLCLPAAVGLLVCVPLIPLSIMAVMRVAKRTMRRYWGSYTDLGASFLESIQGLTTLKVYQADEARHQAMNREAEGFRQATMRLLRMQLSSIAIMDLFAFGGAAVGILLTLGSFAAGSVTFAGAFTVIFLSAEFFIPLRALGSYFHTAMNGMAVAEKMFAILDVAEPARGTRPVEGTALVARGVGYSYDDERAVLDGVDAEARPGELVGIAGASGSGKSTLAAVLAGAAQGFTGAVELGGADIRQIDPDALRRAVVRVGHDSYLFKGTVRENLLMAAPAAPDETLWDALRRCRLDAFVAAAGGLDAPVAARGSNLSGGQRQRLALARAILADAPVYLLDEATSSVDAESEAAIVTLVEELARTRTVVMVAHRLSTLAGADRIYVMDRGRVAESGTHAELTAGDGPYAAMWARQAALEERLAQETQEGAETAARAAAAPGAGAETTGADGGTTGQEGAAGAGADAGADAPGVGSHDGLPARRRSALAVMVRLAGLTRPLLPVMALACVLGVLGFLAAIFLTVLGTLALLGLAGEPSALAPAVACGLVATCGAARGPLRYGEQLCNHYLAFRILALVRDRVFAALRRLAPARLEGKDRGDLVALVTADIELLEVFYAHTLSPAVIALVTSLVMVAFIGSLSPALGALAAASYALVGIAVPRAASRASGTDGRAVRDGVGALNTYVLDSLQGLAETLQYGRSAERAAGLRERMVNLSADEERLKGRGALFSAGTGALVTALDVAMLLAAAALVAADQISFAQGALATASLMASFGPVIAAAALGSGLQQTLASGARVLDLLDERPETAEVPEEEGAPLTAFTGLEADAVSFAYRGGEEVLADVELAVRPGEVVQVTGRSGTGKSTLLKLLMRFWDPRAGVVRMSGRNLREVGTASLRARQGHMAQDTHLFTGTLRDNLLIARPDADDGALADALEKAALADLVAQLPEGIDTPVGELGGALSGGERQRLGLARVFLQDAPLVLLDEPTSNLDALSEAAVLEALATNRAGRTIVLVSHRATASTLADRTYSVDRGGAS